MQAVHIRRSLMSAFAGTIMLGSLPFNLGTAQAGDPYAYFDPANPRPDFFRFPVYNAWVPYRTAYNRPTKIGGHVAAIIEPTSQEAMAWKIAKANGDYKSKRPGYIPTFFYPKPWEALQTEVKLGDRQDSQTNSGLATVPPVDVD